MKLIDLVSFSYSLKEATPSLDKTTSVLLIPVDSGRFSQFKAEHLHWKSPSYRVKIVVIPSAASSWAWTESAFTNGEL